MDNLLKYKKNIFSQNGEDDIIEQIFNVIGTTNKVCCEFGAWDGIHFCNVRNLILNHGWTGILIEGEKDRYSQIKSNYQGNQVIAINKFVDADQNSLYRIISNDTDIKDIEIDFLSIDIDGLDYEIFENLDIDPRVICIEVNAGHHPDSAEIIDREIAKNNVGQSLRVFTQIANSKGYSLVTYTGNAFFIRTEILNTFKIMPIKPMDAYNQFILNLSFGEKEWLYSVNKGIVPPHFHFNNNLLSYKNLNLNKSVLIRQIGFIIRYRLNILSKLLKKKMITIRQINY